VDCARAALVVIVSTTQILRKQVNRFISVLGGTV
jgi:hypothetical protein